MMKNRKVLSLLMSAALIIPAYPGSKKMWIKKMVHSGIEIELTQYQSPDPATKIIEFYKSKLLAEGWYLNYEDKNGPTIYLTGEDRSQLTISCRDMFKRGINDIVIAHSSGINPEILQAMTTNADFPGKDIPSVPRYPNSIRKLYTEADKNIQLIYESGQGCLDCVVRFYQAELVARGWVVTKQKKTDLGAPLLAPGPIEMSQEVQDYVKTLRKYPFIILIAHKRKENLQLSITQKDRLVYVNITYFSGS